MYRIHLMSGKWLAIKVDLQNADDMNNVLIAADEDFVVLCADIETFEMSLALDEGAVQIIRKTIL